jgi:hypothetical protein
MRWMQARDLSVYVMFDTCNVKKVLWLSCGAIMHARSYIDQVLTSLLVLRLLSTLRLLPRRLARVELLNNLRVDPVQLLFGEDAQQRPCKVERIEDGPAFVGA